MEDFAADVENLAVRSTTLNEAQQLATRFNRLATQLDTYSASIDEQVGESVNQINRILTTIAELNKQIVATESGGVTEVVANDLRDQRGEAVKELYEYMDVDVVERSRLHI